MKLINHTLLFLSGILLVTVCLWGVLFYYQLMGQENTSDVPVLDNEKLFKRFAGNQGNKNSTGLGLAIVKAISDISGLRIAYLMVSTYSV